MINRLKGISVYRLTVMGKGQFGGPFSPLSPLPVVNSCFINYEVAPNTKYSYKLLGPPLIFYFIIF